MNIEDIKVVSGDTVILANMKEFLKNLMLMTTNVHNGGHKYYNRKKYIFSHSIWYYLSFIKKSVCHGEL